MNKKRYAVVIPLDKEREDMETIIKPSENKEGWGTIRLEQTEMISAPTKSGGYVLVEDKRSTYVSGEMDVLKKLAPKMGAKVEGTVQVLISSEPFYEDQEPVMNPETDEVLDYYRTTQFILGNHDAPLTVDWDEFRENNPEAEIEVSEENKALDQEA